MKCFFPKRLTEANDINCRICRSIAEGRYRDADALLSLSEETRILGLTETSKQFVTPIDREDIATLFNLAYELSLKLGKAIDLSVTERLKRQLPDMLKNVADNCNTVCRILEKDSLPAPGVLFDEFNLSGKRGKRTAPLPNSTAGLALYYAVKDAEDTSYRMLDYILRSSIKNN